MSHSCTMCSEENTRNLFVNLKVLGKIDAEQKLNTKDKFIGLDDSTWYQCILRKYRGDSRENTISKINKIIEQTKVILDDALKSNSDESFGKYLDMNAISFLGVLLPVLKDAENGLGNLRKTYNQDWTISSQIEMGLLVFQKYIKEIEFKLN